VRSCAAADSALPLLLHTNPHKPLHDRPPHAPLDATQTEASSMYSDFKGKAIEFVKLAVAEDEAGNLEKARREPGAVN